MNLSKDRNTGFHGSKDTEFDDQTSHQCKLWLTKPTTQSLAGYLGLCFQPAHQSTFFHLSDLTKLSPKETMKRDDVLQLSLPIAVCIKFKSIS